MQFCSVERVGAAVHALIPLKRLDAAKSRLRGLLSKEERVQLMRVMLSDVLGAVDGARSISAVTLVSSEPSAAGLARDHEVAWWDDRGLPWNAALSRAMTEVVDTSAVAVISADIPLVRADEIEQLVIATPSAGIAIARASDGGTNAVCLQPTGVVETCFGRKGSAALHASRARGAGVEATIIDAPGLAHDLDTPEDVQRFLAVRRSTRTRELVSSVFSMEVPT